MIEILGRTCRICKKEIAKNKPSNTVYCSNVCAIKAAHNRNEYWSASRKADRGAMSELVAAADLLEQGFEVYRNVSPQGSADLIIRRKDVLLSVEVRTAQKDIKTGHVHCTRKNLRSDILALVFKDVVLYEPNLPEKKL